MLTVYNTLTRKKERFEENTKKKVSIYACGVTVYDDCHLGHARTYLAADVIVRYMLFKGFEVNYVRNITDIDDKIINRSKENNEAYFDLANRYIDKMHADFKNLDLVEPQNEPRATQFIPQMIELIKRILENNHGYLGENGDVYFNVRSFPQYGALSHHSLNELESGIRVEISPGKHDPLDFVLWKKAKPGEPSWSSPWGEGRPGWHIECSAMSMALLGENFDMHFGGQDLIFPHHENEIAQSVAATHTKFVNYWLHTGFLQVEKEKMSKSLKNFVTIQEVLSKYDAETLRFLFVSSHYRSPLTYSEELLSKANQALSRLYTALRFLPKTNETISGTSYETKFITAMDDDFNTPIALSVLFELAKEINRLKDSDPIFASKLGQLLKKMGNVLGLLNKDPEFFFKGLASVTDEINTLIASRQKARENKNWAEADRIRKELLAKGILIEDTTQGTIWKKI